MVTGWIGPAGAMSATDLKSSGVLTGVKVSYPVDFWLFDTRVTLDFKSDAFAAAWPHPAVVAQQAARWPSGGHIYSYRHAATTLAEVGAKLAVALKLHPVETQCTDVEAIDGEHFRTTGLAPGQYACWNPVTYSWCPAASPPGGTAASENENVTHVDKATCDGDDGVAGGAVAGIAVACAFVGLALGAGLVLLLKRGPAVKRHKSFEVDVAERRKEEEKL